MVALAGTLTNGTASAPLLHRFRTVSHHFRTTSAPLPHRFRTVSHHFSTPSKRPGELSRRLAISLAGISQLFFSFLTFLLLFAQYGGAIYNSGTLTVKYGIFTGNSATYVCILAPHSKRSQLAIFLARNSSSFREIRALALAPTMQCC